MISTRVETVRGLTRFGYPAYKSHKSEHDLFVKTVNEFQQKLDDGKFVVTVEITNFIKGWIRNHIMGTDQKYSGFFVSHGVK